MLISRDLARASQLAACKRGFTNTTYVTVLLQHCTAAIWRKCKLMTSSGDTCSAFPEKHFHFFFQNTKAKLVTCYGSFFPSFCPYLSLSICNIIWSCLLKVLSPDKLQNKCWSPSEYLLFSNYISHTLAWEKLKTHFWFWLDNRSVLVNIFSSFFSHTLSGRFFKIGT